MKVTFRKNTLGYTIWFISVIIILCVIIIGANRYVMPLIDAPSGAEYLVTAVVVILGALMSAVLFHIGTKTSGKNTWGRISDVTNGICMALLLAGALVVRIAGYSTDKIKSIVGRSIFLGPYPFRVRLKGINALYGLIIKGLYAIVGISRITIVSYVVNLILFSIAFALIAKTVNAYSGRLAALIVVAYISFSPYFINESIAANSSNLELLLLGLMLYIFIPVFKKPSKVLYAVLAGGVVGFLIGWDNIFFSGLGLIVAILLVQGEDGYSLYDNIKSFLSALLPCAAIALLVIVVKDAFDGFGIGESFSDRFVSPAYEVHKFSVYVPKAEGAFAIIVFALVVFGILISLFAFLLSDVKEHVTGIFSLLNVLVILSIFGAVENENALNIFLYVL
nr:hypothetical protein [Lachnospiraceae bacterium]